MARDITIDLVTLNERLEQLAKSRGLEVRAYIGAAPHAGAVWYDQLVDEFAVELGLRDGEDVHYERAGVATDISARSEHEREARLVAAVDRAHSHLTRELGLV